MAKRQNQKLKLLYLSKILLENTDTQNAITMSEILKELQKYGISAERKSVYDDIEALRLIGIDVQTTRDRYVRYYVAKRDFDLAELKIFFDVVSSLGILGENKTRELLKKFKMPIPNDIFSISDSASSNVNEETYKNISSIINAIYTDRKIRFKCFEYNSRKQKVVSFDGEYFIVSPIKLIFDEGHYALLCFNEATDSEEIYNVERMLNLSAINIKRNRSTSASANTKEKYMLENVRLLCDNSIATDVFERFGLDVTVLANREQCFEISVKTQISPSLFAWIFTYGGLIKIIGPEWVFDEYAELLQKATVR